MTVTKPDTVTASATEVALEAAQEVAGDFGVGEHLGAVAAGERVVVHAFACLHPAYAGWHWAVTLVRASRARIPTVNEVVLLPGDEALQVPSWVPWAERVQPGDLAPGMLLPMPENDPRVVPGYTGEGVDESDAVVARAVAAELGLGRERLLGPYGRDEAVERWSDGEGGPHTPSAKMAPAPCASCAFFVRLRGSLGVGFGACANATSPSDGRVVSIDHGCGAHSDIIGEPAPELGQPVWDTVGLDESLFD